LGRGLGALLGQPTQIPQPVRVDAMPELQATGKPADQQLVKLPIDLLQRGKYQPRTDMRQETLQDLADSIRSQGIIQPIVVRPVITAPGQPTQYEIIAGERRWRAAQLAGLHEIPAVVRHVADEAAVAMALIENIQRENLNPLEEAIALDRLIKEFNVTHQDAAVAVGRSRAAVSNLLRLLDLAEDVKRLVEHRELEMGHARALLSLPLRRQVEVAKQVVNKGLSVRETEALVRRAVQQEAHPEVVAPRSDPNVKKLEADLAEKLGAKVEVQHSSKGTGKVIISYHSLDELDGILGHIK
jgi:ParB family chromosome partitioning protein